MDITPIYIVIPKNERRLPLKYFFHQRANKRPGTETLFRFAELVLTINCFSFSVNCYKQVNAVAMVAKMKCNLVILTFLSVSSKSNVFTNFLMLILTLLTPSRAKGANIAPPSMSILGNLSSFRVLRASFIFSFKVLFQVPSGLPLLRFLGGAHLNAVKGIRVVFIQSRTCTNHLHRLCFT